MTTASAEPEPAAALEPSAAPKADDAPRRHVVAAIGDSLTDEKVGGGGYLKVLRAACPESRFDDFGKGADMVNQMRRRFFRSVYPDGNASAAGYTDVIVFGGVNDLYSDLTAGRTPKKVARDLSAMYETAKKHGARVIAVTVAPWGGFRKYYNPQRAAATRELNAWIAEQPATGGVDVVVDAYALLSCGDPEVLCPAYAHAIRDGLHFGKPGHDKLGAALKERAFPHCR